MELAVCWYSSSHQLIFHFATLAPLAQCCGSLNERQLIRSAALLMASCFSVSDLLKRMLLYTLPLQTITRLSLSSNHVQVMAVPS